MAIQEIENDAYDLELKPAAAAVAVGNRLLVHKIVRHHGFISFDCKSVWKLSNWFACVILRSGLKKKYIPAGEYLNLSLERERFKYCRDIFFLKHCLLSSVKERMAIQEIENDAYDLELNLLPLR